MAIETKDIDLTKEDLTEQQWAEQNVGTWMNMLNAIRWDEVTNTYRALPVKYSSCSLEGEKIRFANGQDYTVICSVLASEYAHKQEVRDLWVATAEKLRDDYIAQAKIDSHIATHNTDLKRLRKEGKLLDSEDME